MNLNKIRIPQNYVLVKVDEHLKTYQRSGKELGILSADFKYENGNVLNVSERNASVNGTVYAVPEVLQFNLKHIRGIKSRYSTHKIIDGQLAMINLSVQKEIDQLFETSIQFDTDMEVKIGDRVNFSYMAHKKAIDDNKKIATDEGDFYFIKYDMLYMTLNEEDKPKKMLNGYLIVEPDIIETKKEGAAEFTTTSTGLVLPTLGHKFKKSKKSQIGTILNIGTRNRGYLQRPEQYDFKEPVEPGRKIIYDPRLAQRMEYENHQIMSDKILHLIQRPGVLFLTEKGFDVSKLNFEKNKAS